MHGVRCMVHPFVPRLQHPSTRAQESVSIPVARIKHAQLTRTSVQETIRSTGR